MAQVEVLAGADRGRGRRGDLAHGVDVLGRHRLLEPHQLQGLEVLREADGAVLVEPRVQVGGDVDLGPRRLDHHLGEAHHAVVLPAVGGHVEGVLDVVLGLAAGVAVGADVEVDLERGEAGLQHLVDHLPDLAHVHAGRDLAVAIDADVVAEPAAQELVDRRLQRLALQIPERDLDAGERGDQRAGEAALEDEAAPDVLEDGVDGEGVAAGEARRQLLDDGDRLIAAMHAFADTGDAGIGLDLHP